MTDVPPRIYSRKTAARPFDIIHDIPRSLSLAQSLLKGQNAPIYTSGTHAYDQCLKSRPFGSWPGRPGPKISPGRADLGRKFFRAGPTQSQNSHGPGRLGPKISNTIYDTVGNKRVKIKHKFTHFAVSQDF